MSKAPSTAVPKLSISISRTAFDGALFRGVLCFTSELLGAGFNYNYKSIFLQY
jgi:hypothetical protein